MIKNLRKAFTIIELVIVIAVIAVLAAVLIPTFSSLVDKANESVDMQLVKQMNTILEAEEITDDKPSTVIETKKVLEDNGINQFKPIDSNNVFYWVSTKNIVLLYNNVKNKVVYPKEYTKEEKLETVWFDLNFSDEEVDVKPVITPSEGQSITEALIEAISEGDAAKEIYVTLPENTNINMSGTEFTSFLSSMSSNSQGKKVHIDLNGGVICTAGGANNNFEVEPNGLIELTNGSYKNTSNSNDGYFFRTASGASVILRDIELEGAVFCCIGATSESNEIILDNVNINVNASYVISTNGITSSNLRVVVTNSNLVNGDGLGILINSTGIVYVDNTTISAGTHCIVVRAGSTEVKNSTLKIISETAGDFKWNEFIHFKKTVSIDDETQKIINAWADGNKFPGGALVLGDYANVSSSYYGDVNCTLDNVTFASVNTDEFPNILVAAKYGKNVNLVYENTDPGNVTFYGMIPEWYGSITINNLSYNYDGTEKTTN